MVDTGGKERAGGARASSAPGTAWRWACWRRAARLAQAPSHSMDDASFPMVPRYRGGGACCLHSESDEETTGKSARKLHAEVERRRVRVQVAGRRAMGNAPCSGVCAEADRTSALAAKPLDATRVDRSKPAPGQPCVCDDSSPR